MNAEQTRLHAEIVRLRAQHALDDLRIRPSVIARIRELHGGGLNFAEVSKHTKIAPDVVRLVLKAGA